MSTLAEGNSKDPQKEPSYEKPCRTCMDFKSWVKLNSKLRKKENSEGKNSDGQGFDDIKNFNIAIEDEYGGRGTAKVRYNTASRKKIFQDPDEDDYPKWGLAAKYGCPADSVSLGRGTWRLLHSIAAYYPDSPSDEVKKDMNSFITLFSKFYPCRPCAEDFREWLKENPPNVSSKSLLSKWFCVAHNVVNRKLGKSEFNCDLLDQRWHDGWKDGSCD
ncbi:FAD-linked sulfhydryl oxidase ALR [Armadillidium vulgare]|nr:FAD-linked sulfhydryl oxidase ALR [Armadillidium vulgare]